jgi:hypothetical protein
MAMQSNIVYSMRNSVKSFGAGDSDVYLIKTDQIGNIVLMVSLFDRKAGFFSAGGSIFIPKDYFKTLNSFPMIAFVDLPGVLNMIT